MAHVRQQCYALPADALKPRLQPLACKHMTFLTRGRECWFRRCDPANLAYQDLQCCCCRQPRSRFALGSAGHEGFETIRYATAGRDLQAGRREVGAVSGGNPSVRRGPEIRKRDPVPATMAAIADDRPNMYGNPLRSSLTSLNRAASDLISSAMLVPTASQIDDACTHDEDELAELQAHPSMNAAMRCEQRRQMPQAAAATAGNFGSIKPRGRISSTSPPPKPQRPTQCRPAEAPRQPGRTQQRHRLHRMTPCRRHEDRLANFQAKPSVRRSPALRRRVKCSK